jgi:hypothetical protein
MVPTLFRNPLLGGEKPLHQPNKDDLGTWLIGKLFSQQRGSQLCLDSRKSALCPITIMLPFCGGLRTEPRPKRHVPDYVRWPTSLTSLRRAFTVLGLLPDRPPQPLTTRNDNVQRPEAPPR